MASGRQTVLVGRRVAVVVHSPHVLDVQLFALHHFLWRDARSINRSNHALSRRHPLVNLSLLEHTRANLRVVQWFPLLLQVLLLLKGLHVLLVVLHLRTIDCTLVAVRRAVVSTVV